jgi:molybdopterin/thiamine biosynthesis adenylyltransferase
LNFFKKKGFEMNYDRISSTIDVPRMQLAHVTVVGGAYGLTQDLARCGVRFFSYVDFDRVDVSNPARQDFTSNDIGQYKAQVLAESLKHINPDVEVNYHIRDFCEFSEEEFDAQFGHTDLFIFATDFFPAQARGNLQALRLRKPAVWIGLYRGGRAGEVIYWMPGTTPACFRCICSSRYRAFHEQSNTNANLTQVPSTGGTILDLHLVDAIAGQIAVGLLTAGAENRMGRLIQQLGNRNLLQIKIDPEYRLGNKDIFRQYLGKHPANFSFNTIALPMEPEADCPDCASFRQHQHGQAA